MKKIAKIVGILLCMSFFLSACGAQGNVDSAPKTTEIVHQGDMWYLPINQAGLPEANIGVIFQAIADWQAQHPDLSVVDVDYLYMQNTYSMYTTNFTYGISILTAKR